MIEISLIFGIMSNILSIALFSLLFWQLGIKKSLYADLFPQFFPGLQISVLLKLLDSFLGLILNLLEYSNLFFTIVFYGLSVSSNVIYLIIIEKYLSSKNLYRLPAIASFGSITFSFIINITDMNYYDITSFGAFGLIVYIVIFAFLPYLLSLILGIMILRKNQERPGLSPTCKWIGSAILFETFINIGMIFFSSLLYILYDNSMIINIINLGVNSLYWIMHFIGIYKIGQMQN